MNKSLRDAAVQTAVSFSKAHESSPKTTTAPPAQPAPFWFDTLNKIIVVRSTIKPQEKSPNEPSKG